jgi:hypothetical protein
MAGHGGSNRGLEAGALPGLAKGRFGRMFEAEGPVYPLEAMEALADAMIKHEAGSPITTAEPDDENPVTPAGYTYFGQFVDHDLTFDPTPLRHQLVDISALEDFRTPALDLDCIFGRGPDDQPYMYQNGGMLRLGAEISSPGAVIGTKRDVHRLPDGVAVLGDKRNDENRIVTQIQSTLISLHNKLLAKDEILGRMGVDLTSPEGRFRAAVAAARWHYQWVVLFDFLDQHICMPGVVKRVLNSGATPRIPNYTRNKAEFPYIPIEFAGAAYRLGHSMVRPSYALNQEVGTDEKDRIPTFSRDPSPLKNLNGFGIPIPKNWGIDWAFFLNNVSVGKHPGFKLPQPSYRLDAVLVEPLSDLPEFRGAQPPKMANLAMRNLTRGSMLQLPTGERVAQAIGIVPLPPGVLWSAGARTVSKVPEPLANFAKARQKVFQDHKSALEGRTPLWYYVLREAEYYGVERDKEDGKSGLGGQHLGPLGSQIIAETIIGILWSDPTSFLHKQVPFVPLIPAPSGKRFTLADLVTCALT